MNLSYELKRSLRGVGHAIRHPEALVVQAQRADTRDTISPLLVPVLLGNAAFGLAAYGLAMQLHHDWTGMLKGAVLLPLAAGVAWLMALPALYIVKSALGSKLDFSTTLLAASATVSFAATAMLASVPVTWFFQLALPEPDVWLATNALVFLGVGACMADVFLRVMRALEPERNPVFHYVWLGLLAVIGGELLVLSGLIPLWEV